MDGGRTVNVAKAESEAGLPVAVTVYELGATFATTNVADSEPPEIEQLNEAIEPASLNEHVVSPDEKPEPDT
jgi:hypothetical protein